MDAHRCGDDIVESSRRTVASSLILISLFDITAAFSSSLASLFIIAS